MEDRIVLDVIGREGNLFSPDREENGQRIRLEAIKL
jgi:hypothetical protein